MKKLSSFASYSCDDNMVSPGFHMVLVLSCKDESCSADKDNHRFYGTVVFITVFAKPRSWIIVLSSSIRIQFTFLHHIVTCSSDSRRDFGLEVGFINHFNTRLVITINYSAIADIHTLQITTAHAKSLQSAVSSPVVHW
jgi:hypothetical protein